MNLTKTETIIRTQTKQLLRSGEIVSAAKNGKESVEFLGAQSFGLQNEIPGLTRVKITGVQKGRRAKTIISSYTVKSGNQLLTCAANFKNNSITCIKEIFDKENRLVKKITGRIKGVKIKNECPSPHIFERFANFFNNCEQYFITAFKDGKARNVTAVVREQNPVSKEESVKIVQILKNGKSTPYGLKLKHNAANPVEAIDLTMLNDNREETLTNITTLLSDKRVARANYKRGFSPQFEILHRTGADFQNGVKNLWQTKEVYSLPLTNIKSDLLNQRFSIKTGQKITSFFKSFMNSSQKIIEIKKSKDGKITEKTVSFVSNKSRPEHSSPTPEHIEKLNKLAENVRIKLITKFKNGIPAGTIIEAVDKKRARVRIPWSDEYKHQFRAVGQ